METSDDIWVQHKIKKQTRSKAAKQSDSQISDPHYGQRLTEAYIHKTQKQYLLRYLCSLFS